MPLTCCPGPMTAARELRHRHPRMTFDTITRPGGRIVGSSGCSSTAAGHPTCVVEGLLHLVGLERPAAIRIEVREAVLNVNQELVQALKLGKA